MSELIELRNVTLTMEGHDALREISVGFPEGRSTVIMGPSGCGKSTLLKVAAGLIPPSRGGVYYRGEDLYWMSPKKMHELRKTNGFMFQDAALWENKSVFENLALPLQVHFPELGRAEIERKVVRLVERGELVESLTMRPAQLSFGERKIASFLRAVIGEPSLVFLDSPTGTIDPALAERVIAMIREIKARGCSIVAVSNDRRIASTIADRLLVLSGGSLLAAGEFNEVKRSSDPHVRAVLAEVLGEIASFDTDLLSLLDEGESKG